MSHRLAFTAGAATDNGYTTQQNSRSNKPHPPNQGSQELTYINNLEKVEAALPLMNHCWFSK